MFELFQHWTGSRTRAATVLAATAFLAACGSTEEDEPGTPADTPAGADREFDVELSGSVGDGPIAAASLRVIASDGTVLSEVVSDGDATYSVQFRTKGKHYPLTIESTGGIDLVTDEAPGFTLRSVAVNPGSKATANINPFTTLAVAAARQMSGGPTSANLSVALDSVMREFNSGLTSSLSVDPLATPITDSNLAEVVKSSEALAEVFRRVHAGVEQSGLTLDDVIGSIAGDLTDGVLDGNGSVVANARVSALTVVASSQVMLEAMRNEIRVGGDIVTPVLDAIVEELATDDNPPLTGSRPVTTRMIAQARRGIDAALALGDSAALSSLRADLDAVTAGMSAADVSQIIGGQSADSLGETLDVLESASDAEVTATLTGTPQTEPPVPSNSLPRISGTPTTTVDEGADYAFLPTATDADGDTLIYRISGLPAWLVFDSSSGLVSGTPSAADVGTFGPIVISVSDGIGSAALAPFSITVVGAGEPPPPPTTNTVPVISGTPTTTVDVGMAWSFTPTASDADGDPLNHSISGRPAWASFDTATGLLAGTPTAAGTYGPIVISVSDGIDSAALAPFSITVVDAGEPPPPPNTAPVISGTPATTADEGVTWSFTPTASDADSDTLTFSISGRPAWASFNPATGRLIGTPSSANVGTFGPIVISVSDGTASTSLAAFSITVEAAAPPPNAAPQISGTPSTSVGAGTAWSFTPTASDADGDALTFSISGRPAWASFNPATGRLNGTPTTAGTYGPIVISVSDGTDGASLAAFSITVAAPVTGSATLSWTPPTENTDGSPLTDLAGYRIRWGQQSGSYTSSATIMNPGITTYVVDDLSQGTHYFTVLAINASGVESNPSNEASKTIN